MSKAISDLGVLLSSMTPELNPRRAAFLAFPSNENPFPQAVTIGTFRESEGLTVIVDLAAAEQASYPIVFKAAWITLTVHSTFEAVGLTAAFAKALGDVGISANVVAGAFHDHIFVPIDKAEAAMTALRELQRRSSGG